MFYNGKFVFPDFFYLSASFAHLPPSAHGNHQCDFCIHIQDFLFVCFLGFTYEWDHMVFVFLCSVWFISLSMILSRSIQFVTNGSFILFLWLNYILLCIYYIFFIHSDIIEHLGHFHILPVANNSSVSMKVPVCFQVSIFFFFQLHCKACGILVSRTNMGPWQWKCKVLITGQPGSSLKSVFSFSLDKHLEVGLQDGMAVLFLTF